MIRALLGVLATLALAPAALAAPPTVTARADVAAGAAPLAVTLTAEGDAASYRWDLGDGSSAEGAVVRHEYEAGAFVATVTATSAAGETATATVAVTAYRVSFGAPARGAHGARGRFSGSIFPPVASAPVAILGPGGGIAARGRTMANGGFRIDARLHGRGPFRARIAGVVSEPDAVLLRPALETRLVGSPVVGGSLALVARLRPAAAGALAVTVRGPGGPRVVRSRGGTIRVPLRTAAVASYTLQVASSAAGGYAPVRRTVRAAVVRPDLRRGARGPSVLALERRLAELRYALPRVDSSFGYDTVEALYAFQKVHGLPVTGRADARTWATLARASTPLPRHRGTYLEVSKPRQLLYVVRDGKVETIVHVSTGLTGNTPVGTWRVYRKVPGFDWVLYYPLYFLRGFAIHGYPEVPTHPASHGCVRVPMWIAPRIYSQFSHGAVVRVF